MKTLLLSIFAMSLIASEQGNDLYAFGMSYHSNHEYPNYHQFNPGIGVGHYWVDGWVPWTEMTVQATVYKNSYANWTGIATFGPRAILGDRNGLHAIVSVNAGAMVSDNYSNLIIMPAFGVGYKDYSANIIYIPKPASSKDVNSKQDTAAAIGLFLGMKF